MTIEDAIKMPINKREEKQLYTYKNFTGTLPKIIEYFGLDIKYITLRQRIDKGMSIDEAIEYPIIKRDHKTYIYKDFKGTLFEIITTLRARLRQGMLIEEAVEKLTKKQKAKQFYIYKNFTGTLQEIINRFELNINISTLNGRLQKGMSIEEAIEYSFSNKYLDKLKQLFMDENVSFVDIYNLIDGVPYTMDKIKKMIEETTK